MAGGIAERRGVNRLSDRAIRAFLSNTRAGKASKGKLFDGGGLFLTVSPAGTPIWRCKYRIGGKERLYAIGVYPAISLEGARAEREAVKSQIREGRDPVKARQLNRIAAVTSGDATFSRAADAWLSHRRADWSGTHLQKSRRALERDVLPLLGGFPLAEITPAMIARTIEAIAKRGAADTAGKVLQHVVSIFRLAQARGLVQENPAVPVREVLPRRRDHSQRPALLAFDELGELLRRLEVAPISPPVRVAHRLVGFTAARIGNVITSEWDEFELDGDLPSWIVPRRKMKMRDRKHDHRVLLGPTIAADLRAWKRATGGRGFLFPSVSGRAHITHESLEKSMRLTIDMEGKHSVHGWRSSFSTLARENGFPQEVVELALDHIVSSEVVRAYDRGERLAQRRKLFAWWDESLSRAQSGAKIVPVRATGVA
jgi:integrase